MNNKSVKGVDMVDLTPSYNQNWNEYWEEYRERYFKVYGEYPPKPEESKKK
jgi:hypothetical protein